VNRSIQIAPVRKSVVVAASPERAFAVFTSGLDRWWPKTHGIGAGPVEQSIIEPFVGGRWYARHAGGVEVVVGHVQVWQPGERLVVTWEVSPDWKPDPRPAFTSEVEVIFAAEGDGHTRVEVEHRNFERLGAQGGEKMRKDVDGGWPTILELFAKEVAREGVRS